MFDLPKPKLGNVSGLTINTPDLERSLEFYQKIGFRELFRGDFPFRFIQISDDQIQIMLRHAPEPYFALTYYVAGIDDLTAGLENDGVEFWEKANRESDFIKRCRLNTPDGFTISLVMLVDGFDQPPGPTMLTLPQTDYYNPEKYRNHAAGMLGEIAYPVKDLDVSIAFWEKLGFKVLSKFGTPRPWAILSDGLNAIGLHQADDFDRPAITYFASDMAARIEKLKAAGLTDFTEKGPGNIVLNTPEGQHVNLFKFGM